MAREEERGGGRGGRSAREVTMVCGTGTPIRCPPPHLASLRFDLQAPTEPPSVGETTAGVSLAPSSSFCEFPRFYLFLFPIFRRVWYSREQAQTYKNSASSYSARLRGEEAPSEEGSDSGGISR